MFDREKDIIARKIKEEDTLLEIFILIEENNHRSKLEAITKYKELRKFSENISINHVLMMDEYNRFIGIKNKK